MKNIVMKDALMQFDPATGESRPYPSHADQWRKWHGRAAWIFNPWTGNRRNAHDVGSDTFGILIVPPGTLGDDLGGSPSLTNAAPPVPQVDPDWLANVIRTVDGSNTMGALALAEKIAEAINGRAKWSPTNCADRRTIQPLQDCSGSARSQSARAPGWSPIDFAIRVEDENNG